MKNISPVLTIRSGDNWLDDINSFMNYIMEEFIDSKIIINEGPKCSLVWRNNKNDDNYFIGQIITERNETLYSLKFVFNKKGLSSFGLFSLHQRESESPIKKELYSQRPILLMGGITLKTFFENFFCKIKNQLI